MSNEGEGEAAVPAEAVGEAPAAAATAESTSKSALDELRGKVDGELADAKTKTWQNIKMRTKMSILQVEPE